MHHHVAILHSSPLKLILDGQKTIESRITRGRLAPWGCIHPGDIIHLKKASGPFVAKAVAARVHSFDHLTPHRLNQLRLQFNHLIHGPDEYWQKKQHCQYATFIELANIKPVDTGPAFPKSYGQAWFVLNQTPAHTPAKTPAPISDSSACQITLTAGAIKNRYMPAPSSLPKGPITLLLPTGRTLETHVTAQRRIASRKWAAAFKNLAPGDIVIFVPITRKRYRVTFKTVVPHHTDTPQSHPVSTQP